MAFLKRKIVFLSGGIFLFFLLGLIVVKFFAFSKIISPLGEREAPKITETPWELATWVDQAEFRFQYPKNLTLSPHDEDQENYAHLELSSSSHPGNLIVWVKDAPVKDLEEWVRKEKISGAIESVLGGKRAKKVFLPLSDGQKMLVTALRDDYLYQIEVNLKDQDFWQKVYQIVSSSFEFLEEETSNSQSPVLPQEELEEEVIE